MTREEIREGMLSKIEATIRLCGQNPITATALSLELEEEITGYLHSQGLRLPNGESLIKEK